MPQITFFCLVDPQIGVNNFFDGGTPTLPLYCTPTVCCLCTFIWFPGIVCNFENLPGNLGIQSAS